MYLRYVSILILVSLLTVQCKRSENDTRKISDLPMEMIGEIRSIIMGGIVKLVGGCSPVNESHVTFHLFNRDNLDDPLNVTIHDLSAINPKKPVILLVHGWISNIYNDGLQTLKDAYLERYDWNVIAVDWSEIAQQFYVKAFCNLPEISNKIGDFLCEMSERLDIKLSNVRMVGHSLGGQISGYTGQRVQQKCNQKLQRITGLDPAGPMYHLLPKDERLDGEDAGFVDVMHTNSGQFGYSAACGTVDFYVNCGSLQPQCPGGIAELSMKEFMNLAVAVVTCHHTISWYYMAESVNDQTNKFKAQSCAVCLAVACVPNLFARETTIMGENTPVSGREAREQKFMSIIFKSPLYKIS